MTQDEQIRAIVNSGALDVRNGSFEVFLDNEGNVRRIETKEVKKIRK